MPRGTGKRQTKKNSKRSKKGDDGRGEGVVAGQALTFFGEPLRAFKVGEWGVRYQTPDEFARILELGCRLTPPGTWGIRPRVWEASLLLGGTAVSSYLARDPHRALRMIETRARQLMHELAEVSNLEVEEP